MTDAEKFGWSFVFQGQLSKALKKKLKTNSLAGTSWWYAVEKARWDKPAGPGSTILKIMNHPVVHISYNDALAYCQWAEGRLPTEAEWEVAARAGVETRFPWGDDLKLNGKYQSKVWDGDFPNTNRSPKEILWTAPAKSFKPNTWGLYNVCGNVWEWTRSRWGESTHEVPDFRYPYFKEDGRELVEGSDLRCVRGSSWYGDRSLFGRCAYRGWGLPFNVAKFSGFRLVREMHVEDADMEPDGSSEQAPPDR